MAPPPKTDADLPAAPSKMMTYLEGPAPTLFSPSTAARLVGDILDVGAPQPLRDSPPPSRLHAALVDALIGGPKTVADLSARMGHMNEADIAECLAAGTTTFVQKGSVWALRTSRNCAHVISPATTPRRRGPDEAFWNDGIVTPPVSPRAAAASKLAEE